VTPATITGAEVVFERLPTAFAVVRREDEQHVERRDDVRAERIGREDRSPDRPIRSGKHVHLDRMERFTGRVAEHAVFRAKATVVHVR